MVRAFLDAINNVHDPRLFLDKTNLRIDVAWVVLPGQDPAESTDAALGLTNQRVPPFAARKATLVSSPILNRSAK